MSKKRRKVIPFSARARPELGHHEAHIAEQADCISNESESRRFKAFLERLRDPKAKEWRDQHGHEI